MTAFALVDASLQELCPANISEVIVPTLQGRRLSAPAVRGDYGRACGLAPSRQIANTAAMIAGPTNNPIRPNVSKPPKIPRRTHRKGRRVDAPNKPGRIKRSATKTTADANKKSRMAAVMRD